MTYEQRSAAIGTLLREKILPRFYRPAHMDDATARLELEGMVEDLTAAWPVVQEEELAAIGRRFAIQVRRTIDGRTWPTIPRLLKALRDTVQTAPYCASRPVAIPKRSRFADAAAHIKAGRPVSEDYIDGPDAEGLMALCLVSDADLQPYRSHLAETRAAASGSSKARVL